MTLDSWLVQRLARELDAAVAEARIQAVFGGDSFFALTCYRRRSEFVLYASLDSDAPLVSLLEKAPSAMQDGARGWAAVLSQLLRGGVITGVHAVPDDRILNVDTVSRSAFGVPAVHRVTIELEPRKANALVLRSISGVHSWSVVAAAKRFEGQRGGRSVTIGAPYEPPPPRRARLDAPAFDAAVATTGTVDIRAVAKLLGDFDPACTPPLARDIAQRVVADDESGDNIGARLRQLWEQLRPLVARRCLDLAAPLVVYRKGAQLLACHVVPLAWANGERGESVALLPLCAEQTMMVSQRATAPAAAGLRKRLNLMLERNDTERAKLEDARSRALEADTLRRAGEAIYANLHAIPKRIKEFATSDGLQITLDPLLSAKANAAAYFKRYRKARSGLPQIELRIRALAQNRAFWEQALWDLDRAQTMSASEGSVALEEIAQAVGVRRREPARPAKRRPPARTPQPVDLGDGARAYVGRSPLDNDRLTFAFARPNDWWFHARGIPGAHVILKLSHAGEKPTQAQIAEAAQLAASHSRAAEAAKVDVDYTQRKHVRRQAAGKPGLVWYTDFQTVLVTPKKLQH